MRKVLARVSMSDQRKAASSPERLPLQKAVVKYGRQGGGGRAREGVMTKKRRAVKVDEELAAGRDLDRIVTRRPRMRGHGIHPWLHHEGNGVIVGRVTDAGAVELVTSARKRFAATDQKDRLLFMPRPLVSLAGRWPDAFGEEWCAGGAVSGFSDLLVRIT
jgi:hypothetical protein